MSRSATAKSIVAAGCFFLLSPGIASAVTKDEFRAQYLTRTATHKIYAKNPNGCRACHSNINYTGSAEEELCYTCHGDVQLVNKMVRKARLVAVKAPDIRKDFQKPFRHPVELRNLYNPKEKFPTIAKNVTRHAECLDCHDPHYSIPEASHLGVSGVDLDGKFLKVAVNEYEVCFKCHGVSTNKPVNQKNKAREFHPQNPSYHPVVEVGKNNSLPSLVQGLTYESKIKCSSCHGSDERSVKRASGVHGSDNNYILVLPYTRDEENLKPQYDLCFKCHRKESILENRSFRYHREHIEGVKSRNWKGTSCSTCHNPHGSAKYRYLIDFNPDYVRKDTLRSRFEFVSEGVFKGSCYLRCHNVDHSPKSYGN